MNKEAKQPICLSGVKFMETSGLVKSTLKDIETSKCIFMDKKELQSKTENISETMDISESMNISPSIKNMLFHLKNISDNYDLNLPLAVPGLEYYFCVDEDNKNEIRISRLDDDIINGYGNFKFRDSEIIDLVFFNKMKTLSFVKPKKGDYWRVMCLTQGIWKVEGYSSNGKSLSVIK